VVQHGEPIRLAPYDPEWPRIFKHEYMRLVPVLARFGLRGIEHVGSTSIPGMMAKPVVDIVAGADGISAIPGPQAALWASLQYEWGHGDDRPDDWLYFIKREADGTRLVHLHVVPFGGTFWNEIIAFRDALRTDRGLARQYEALKVQLAAEYADDRLRYLEGKAQFVRSVLSKRSQQRP
jgi:GrpB-like predicted nucleotidyltransferase (UPF0157 family)